LRTTIASNNLSLKKKTIVMGTLKLFQLSSQKVDIAVEKLSD